MQLGHGRGGGGVDFSPTQMRPHNECNDCVVKLLDVRWPLQVMLALPLSLPRQLSDVCRDTQFASLFSFVLRRLQIELKRQKHEAEFREP